MKDLTATGIYEAAKATQERVEKDWGVFVIFFDQNRETQAVVFPGSVPEADPDDFQDCFEEISECLAEGMRPVCITVCSPDESGDMAFVESTTPLQDEPTIDDQAVMWGLEEEEVTPEKQPQ